MSSTLGTLFKITTYGESHGKSIGVIVEGVPSGLYIDVDFIQSELDKRKPSKNNSFTTKRLESDTVEIHSGVFENKSTGTPIFMQINNNMHNSKDYSHIKDLYRPSHADYTYDKKYNIRDYRGGGRSSGRETASRVAGGAIAKLLLKTLDINICAYTNKIGNVVINNSNINFEDVYNNELRVSNNDDYKKCLLLLEETKKNNDSIGGIIECVVTNVPLGLGEPVFDKLDANISKALMSIGSVKGVEFGLGFEVSETLGSQSNDEFTVLDNKICKKSNNSGGVLGGISDGSDIIIRVAIKPTPSISKSQQTVNKYNENVDLNVTGRHDTIIVPRVASVIESMVAITLADALLLNLSSNIENIKKIYS